jgi:hypothetical protein
MPFFIATRLTETCEASSLIKDSPHGVLMPSSAKSASILEYEGGDK